MGYLLKDTDPVRLPLALQGVLSGQAAIPRDVMNTILQAYRRSEGQEAVLAPAVAQLTARQRQVLELLQ